ncbi:MAG: tetrahydrofolate dehydrogenase/cyclohydrolase catalytic domain-containing protein [Candidatus Saccharibacteria bacterium]
MKVLNGSELAGFIKERQAHEVRGLRQSLSVKPKLAIIVTVEHPAIEVYMRMKQRYGDDILIDVDVHRVPQAEAPALIKKLNADETVHGIIVQLPLENPPRRMPL